MHLGKWENNLHKEIYNKQWCSCRLQIDTVKIINKAVLRVRKHRDLPFFFVTSVTFLNLSAEGTFVDCAGSSILLQISG